jgi:NADH:ubiquinone oxidoreductase subunit
MPIDDAMAGGGVTAPELGVELLGLTPQVIETRFRGKASENGHGNLFSRPAVRVTGEKRLLVAFTSRQAGSTLPADWAHPDVRGRQDRATAGEKEAQL